MIGISIGTGLGDEIIAGFTPTTREARSGRVDLYIGSIDGVEAALLPRHGIPHGIAPHAIDHARNMSCLKGLGVGMVIALSSVGSLTRTVRVPSLVVPDDYIEFAPATVHSDAVHVVPGLSGIVRKALIDSARELGTRPFLDRGTYFQTVGPRLETVAEVKFISTLADIVGMTMGSEATVCRELGIEYASLCTVDNYANGVGGNLAEATIGRTARENTETAWKIVEKAVTRL